MELEGLDPEELCRLCIQPRKNHGVLHHSFVGKGQDPGSAIQQPKKKKDETTTPRIVVAPAPDLVLRYALTRKGLITPSELEAAERELTLGITSTQGQAHDVQSDAGSTGGDSSNRT